MLAGDGAVDAAQEAALRAYQEVAARKPRRNQLSLIKAPESWAGAEQTHVNGHAVSSALEVAGNDVHFPATGAAVRAVPAKQESAGTFWKGASGRKPPRIGDAPDAFADAEDENPPAPLVAPSDIILYCTDGDDKHETEVRVTWEMSWSDVLDELKVKFGRAVVFKYVNADRVMTVCDDENGFDIFCSDAEGFGCQAKVQIMNSGFRPSTWITDAPAVHRPLWSRNNMDDKAEFDAIDGAALSPMGGGEAPLQTLKEGKDEAQMPRKKKGLLARMEDAPYPLPHMLVLGGNGLLVSLGAVVVGFFLNWHTLAAVSAALPCHLFALSFFVSEVEDGASQLVRLGVGFCGFYVAMLVIACYSLTREFIGLIAAFLFLLSSYWFAELCIKARGWDSWFQGITNLWAWIRGGCPLVGIRKPEPLEDIVLLGTPPKPTTFTMFMTLEERHPGATWKPVEVGMRVKHIGQCMQVLSEVRSDGVGGNPMGPWEEGIIHKKLARQLRKWLVRAGRKTDADFKAWKKYPHGIVTNIGGIGTRVEWQDDSTPASFYQTGENGYWELVDFSESDTGPGAGMYDEENIMHTGGSLLLKTQTFLIYFAPRFCAFLWYWIIFFAYFGMLYVFEYSVASYSVYQAMGNAYPARGKFYNIQPGNNYKIHIYCKGGTKQNWDGRPPVLMEAMEGIGQGVYFSRMQDTIAEYGVCCVYDRLGFGFSSDSEDSDVWADRTPKRVAKELHYALTIGVDDTENQNPVSFEKPYIGVNGENLTQYIRVSPPYLLIAHSAGALYARQFAHDYPELVAGMVLVDPLPAEKVCNNADGDKSVQSVQQKMLSPFLMELCQRFLQPVGLVYNFHPVVASSLFPDAVEFELNGGYDKPHNDFQVMMSRMYERQWCPSVMAEYDSLYAKDGIASVLEADKAGYDMPTVIWVRGSSTLEGKYSYDPIYKEDCGDAPAVTTAELATSRTVSQGRYSSESQRAAVLAARLATVPPSIASASLASSFPTISSLATSRRQSNNSADGVSNGPKNPDCLECNLSWDDLMRNLLKSFRGGLTDPFSGKVDIMKGDLQSCASQGCDEYTLIINPKEIYEATVRVWNKLGYRTNFTSLPWHLEMYGRAIDFDAAQFRSDLAGMLRHVEPSDIIIVEGPRQVQQPLTMVPEEDDVGCDPPLCYNGYSGSYFGRANYRPKSNVGYFYLSIVIIGPSMRSVNWAQDNLRSSENTVLDTTAIARRTDFMHQWRLLWLAEDVCLESTGKLDPITNKPLVSCSNRTVDVFSSTFSSPMYECPQNTYKDSEAGRCQACPAQKTSTPGASSENQCFSCQPSLNKETQRWTYTYLKCDGKGCNECPANTLSSPGALGLKGCVPQPLLTVTVKGPIDEGSTSEAITSHRWGRPYHATFDPERFQKIISIISGIEYNRVALIRVEDVWNYPASRCRELRGGCMFDVDILLQAQGGEELTAALERVRGDECYTFPPTDECPFPDVNKTAVQGRNLLFQEFEVVKFVEVKTIGRDTGECPDRYEGGVDVQYNYIDIFKESGSRGVIFTDETYTCPNKFYRHTNGYCAPCPDMTTSNHGAIGIDECEPFNTIIWAAKDASLTYEARTNQNVNGYPDAQPNALTLNDDAPAYLKIRGYALHPDKRVNEQDEAQGLQIERCDFGLNCFNETSFREDLSAMIGSVKPNEVRLVKPNACLVSIDFDLFDGVFDGVERKVPESMSRKEMCGPWPGLLPTAGKCACGQISDPMLTRPRRCYYGLGTGLISRYVGEGRGSEKFSIAETVGACAAIASQDVEANAFLYHAGQMKCSPRKVQQSQMALDPCPSQSKLCRDVAYYHLGGEQSDLLEPGIQMYFAVSNDEETTSQDFASKCNVLIEDCNVLTADSSSPFRVKGACDARLKSPLDSLYYLVNLHAETKTDLVRALRVLRGQEGSGSERGKFMKKYHITQLAIADDKEIVAGKLEREVSVTASGHFDASEPVLFESTALCETDGVFTPALCCKTALCLTSPLDNPPDSEQPEAMCRWDESETPFSITPLCRDGMVPTCPRGQPTCMGERIFDEEPLSDMPMPCLLKGSVSFQWVCAHATMFFKNPKPMTKDSQRCAGTGGEDEEEEEEVDVTSRCSVRPSEMLVTRVDIALSDNTIGIGSGRVMLSFSDGSDQIITLIRTSQLRSYYIRPVVTTFVTLSSVPYKERNADGNFEWTFSGPPLRVAKFDVHGQNMSQPFDNEEYVDIFQPGFVGVQESYACPPTTFANSRPKGNSGRAGATEDRFKGCDSCAYPLLSNEGSNGIINCTVAVCGDGRVAWQSSEQCDDGNNEINDGCAQNCKIEALQLCRGPTNPLSGVGLPIQSYSQKDSCFRLGSSWTSYGLAPWEARYGHRAITHENGLWLVGGISSDASVFFNDAWYETTNGGGCIAPEPDDESRGYLPCHVNAGLEWRASTQLKVASRSGYNNESLDAYKNLKVFEPRGFHGLVDHGNFLWVIGGANRRDWPNNPQSEDPICSEEMGCELTQGFDDVWKSSYVTVTSQGELQWTLVEATVPSGLFWEDVGATEPTEGQEITNTNLADALKFKLEFTKQEWSNFGIPSLRVGDWIRVDSLYIKAVVRNKWESRFQHGVVSFKRKIWIMGGGSVITTERGVTVNLHNDLWSTLGIDAVGIDEGKEWKRVFADLEVGPGSDLFDQVPRKRRGHAVAVDPEGEKIFIFGGLARDGDMDIYLNDVWSTTGEYDGATLWTRIVEEGGNEWYGRYLHSVVVYQDSFWIIGGQYCGEAVNSVGEPIDELQDGGIRGSDGLCSRSNPPEQLGDVWVSSGKEEGAEGQKGKYWNRATEEANWGRRSALAAVNFDNRDTAARLPARTNLWVLGGMDGFTDAHNQMTISFEF